MLPNERLVDDLQQANRLQVLHDPGVFAFCKAESGARKRKGHFVHGEPDHNDSADAAGSWSLSLRLLRPDGHLPD